MDKISTQHSVDLSPRAPARSGALLAASLALSLLAACGQKGPLTPPKTPLAMVIAAPATAAVPAAASAPSRP
ncbi:LPS translocon maturation chaperone LptM [Roseateles koreensis]|uniref:LPS translocon maturation chaperone LptM n=1 Tax=Roseateles koreensis TaxID=2987526 RepID=UPI003964818A